MILGPGGELDIYTDRDQGVFFWVLNFENLYGTGHSCCIFLSSQINAVFLSVLCLQRYFLGPILFTRYFSKHSSSLLSSRS